MNAPRLGALGAIAAAVVLAATASSAAEVTQPRAHAGGTYRVAYESGFSFTNAFDPTGEYLTWSFALYSNLLVRTLLGYNHVHGPAGNKLVPDIATAVPQPTGGGKTYTFHLKRGIRFGPPLNREVTSRDVRYAFERMAKPKNGAQYGFYYSVIAGFDAFGAGKAKKISGIETPDARTIVFHLTQPAGDFPYRTAMPAAGPIPAEVAGCFDGKPGFYGRYLVSTGPYMIEGADKLDASSCKTLKPLSGFEPQTRLTLVRNPAYAASTDSKAARENLPDRFEFTVNPNLSDIVDRVAAGELDDENAASLPAQALRRYSLDASLRKYLHLNSGDLTDYLAMNLTQPPFDDIHVRRAMNWVMDKTAMVQAWGGPSLGKVANHIAPDTIYGNQLAEFAPYRTPGDHGSVAKAKAAMKGSKYDTKGDGTCSAPQCKHVVMLTDTRTVDTKMTPVVQAAAAKIGITFTVRPIQDAYPALQTTRRNIALGEHPGWGKDYADPATFFNPLFDGRTIIPTGNVNYSLVGVKPAQAKSLGLTGNVKGVPSVDAQLDRCAAASGQARLTCYENLDRHVMTDVVPWVPYLWQYVAHVTGPRVTQWDYDQFSGGTAYAHVAVK